MAATQTKNISIDRVRIDGQTQMRAKLDETTVAEYSDAIAGGVTFPKMEVYFDGNYYWLADGFHRLQAYRRNHKKRVSVSVHKGTKEDARWHAIGANQAHGLRRTNKDKERAVKAAIKHPKTIEGKLSDRQIAEHVGVSSNTVMKYRNELESAAQIAHLTERTGKDGKTYPVPEKKTPVKDPTPPEPDEEPEQYVCGECGGPIAEDEEGEYCAKCKAPICDDTQPNKPDPLHRREPTPTPARKTHAERIFDRIKALVDDLENEKGEDITRAMLENLISARWDQ